ncbi:hypothetical protein Pfo_010374 [Paulownia fortunei]|nr:hypothetical protein Pfo_010374 [Paulownia fortunei]
MRRLSLKPRSLSQSTVWSFSHFLEKYNNKILLFKKPKKTFRFLLRRGVAGESGRRSVQINSLEKPEMN